MIHAKARKVRTTLPVFIVDSGSERDKQHVIQVVCLCSAKYMQVQPVHRHQEMSMRRLMNQVPCDTCQRTSIAHLNVFELGLGLKRRLRATGNGLFTSQIPFFKQVLRFFSFFFFQRKSSGILDSDVIPWTGWTI